MSDRPRTLRVCGTAAAEAIPGLHCTCETCQEALRRGGPNLRSRSAYDFGEDLRVDFGPDANLHARAANRTYATLRHMVVTHSHPDHWYPTDLDYRRSGFCVLPDDRPLCVWGNEWVLKAAEYSLRDLEAARVELRLVRAFETYDLEADLRLTTLKAEHARGEEALNLILAEPLRTVLIANDTGYWEEETWEFVAGRHLDVALIDSTYGRYDRTGGHMGAPVVVRFVDRLREIGCLTADSRIWATHFSHNGHATHEWLTEFFEPYGISVAYDGLTID